MDPTNDVIDPLQLSVEEINYELALRGIFNVSNPRTKVATLRDLFQKEFDGAAATPKNSSEVNSSDKEVKTCSSIYEEIVAIANYGTNKDDKSSIEEAYHRMLHLQMRLDRIVPKTQLEAERVYELIDCCVDGIFRLAKFMNGRNNGTSANAGRQKESVQQNQPRNSDVLSFPTNGAGGGTRNSDVLSFPTNVAEGGARNSMTSASGAVPKNPKPVISPRTRFEEVVAQKLPSRLSIQGRESFTELEFLSAEDREEVLKIIRSKIRSNASGPKETLIDLSTSRSTQIEQPAEAYEDDRNQQYFQDRTRYREPPRQLLNRNYPRMPMFADEPTERNWANDAPNPPNPPGAQYYENPARHYNQRRPVPMNQWKISFSGDSKGIHLHDFLTQVELLQRSERLSDEDLVHGLAHLLNGTARTWLTTVQGRFRTWAEVALAMKQRFLPENYDYMLLCQITNNTQKSSESIVEFLTNMQALFNCLTIPIAEPHKLFLIQKNLLPKYAMSIAPLGIRTMQELLEVARRMDCTFQPQSQQLPFQQNFGSFNRQYPRNVSTIDETNEIDEEDQADLMEMRRRNPSNQSPRSPIKCWNCNRIGHSFHECSVERTGIFCFRCGASNVTSINCQKCSKNGKKSSGQTSEAQSSVRKD